MIRGPSGYGALPDGAPASIYTLEQAGLEAVVCDAGASLVALRVPDARGRLADVVLGYDRASEFKHHAGATTGRFAGPIAGGRCDLDGQPLQLPLNGGAYHMHGGFTGFNKRTWSAEPLEEADGPAIRFSRLSPDGEEGYPGALSVRVTYTLTRDRALRIAYEAETDKTTLCNLTNHAYFNLAGHETGPIHGHVARFEAAHAHLNDANLISTGEVVPVKGTPFDFTTPKAIGADIGSQDVQITLAGGYDHTFLLPPADPPRLRLAAEVFDPASGRGMTMWTTEPGFQFYTGNSIPAGEAGKNGAVYGPRQGFCLEAQRAPGWPDRPGPLGALLRPGIPYRQVTLYTFSTVS